MPRKYLSRPKLGAYLRKDEIDPVTYEYTLASTPSRHWMPRLPEQGEPMSPVRVYDGEDRLVRTISVEELVKMGKQPLSDWVGNEATYRARKYRKGKYVVLDGGQYGREHEPYV